MVVNPASLPAGTYSVGTIVWDDSAVNVGSFDIASFLDPALDGFVDGSGSALITDVTLNGAKLVVAPEPGTSALLGLALLGLTLSRRRSG